MVPIAPAQVGWCRTLTNLPVKLTCGTLSLGLRVGNFVVGGPCRFGFNWILKPTVKGGYWLTKKVVIGGVRTTVNFVYNLPLVGGAIRKSRSAARKVITLGRWAVALGTIAGVGYALYRVYGLIPEPVKIKATDLGAASKQWVGDKAAEAWDSAEPVITQVTSDVASKLGQGAKTAVEAINHGLEQAAEAGKDKIVEVATAAAPMIKDAAIDAVTAAPGWAGWSVGKALSGSWWFMSGGFVQVARMFSPLEWLQIGFVGTMYGGVAFASTPFGKKMINDMWDIRTLKAKDAIGRPKLLADFKPARRKNWIWPDAPLVKARPVLNKELQKQLDAAIQKAKNAEKNGVNLPRLLFEGPPGTGKTMAAEYIAEQLGFAIVKMSGAALTPLYANNTHVEEIKKIIDFAKEGKTILFIDECDSFAAPITGGATGDDAKREQALNAFKEATGGDTPNLMLIAACNPVESSNPLEEPRTRLDTAFKSRFFERPYFGNPDQGCRVEILKQQVNKQFAGAEELNTVLGASGLQRIADMTGGFSGRNLNGLVQGLKNQKDCSADRKLTDALIDQTVYRFLMQERSEMKWWTRWRSIEVVSDFYRFTVLKIFRQIATQVQRVTDVVSYPFVAVWDKVRPAPAVAKIAAKPSKKWPMLNVFK